MAQGFDSQAWHSAIGDLIGITVRERRIQAPLEVTVSVGGVSDNLD